MGVGEGSAVGSRDGRGVGDGVICRLRFRWVESREIRGGTGSSCRLHRWSRSRFS